MENCFYKKKKKRLKSCPLLSSAGTAGFRVSLFLFCPLATESITCDLECVSLLSVQVTLSVRALVSLCATFLCTLPRQTVCAYARACVCAFNEGGLHLWITLLHYCIRLYAVAERWGAYISTPATYLQLL